MATQALNTSLTLGTVGTVNGIFTLNNTSANSVNFNDTSVGSSTITVTNTVTEIFAASVGDIRYVYLKNLGTTNWVQVGEASGTKYYAKLGPGEWMFLPVDVSMGIEVKTDTGKTTTLEYAWFTKV
tara:strand:+ start:2131 stop:2508 length:378 start_codon:yes stop_codon:yes gene_type:complete